MSGTQADIDNDLKLNGALFLDVSFGFEKKWLIGPDGQLSKFPPGVGDGGATVAIGPVNLKGLSQAQVAEAVAKRASDMALVAMAVAVANRQFADALFAAGYGTAAS